MGHWGLPELFRNLPFTILLQKGTLTSHVNPMLKHKHVFFSNFHVPALRCCGAAVRWGSAAVQRCCGGAMGRCGGAVLWCFGTLLALLALFALFALFAVPGPTTLSARRVGGPQQGLGASARNGANP